MLSGLSLIIASACVCNNYIDREIDQKMARTRTRALATGAIPGTHGLMYAAVLGIAGIAILVLYTNLLTAALAVFGFMAYVFIYGIAKRRTVHGTVIGSISGAIPPVVGYCAVTGRLDGASLILFLIVALWQMPHFYAIAMFRMADYKAAGIPILPLRRGMQATKRQMAIYTLAFTAAAASLTLLGYTGYLYLAAVVILGASWFWLSIAGLRNQNTDDDARWARKMFGLSLLVISGFCLAITVDSFL
jgi:protoheme IX farnesyltransferase